MLVDILTAAVLVWVGSRLAIAARVAVGGRGRSQAMALVRGLRPHHFLLALPVFGLVYVTAIALLQVPGLDWGWWTALGGFGNPVTGGTDRTTGTPFEWLVPLVFLVMLVPALPLFAEAEERIFRLGAEHRSRLGRLRRSIEFGLAHALVGIPIGAALGLSVGGEYFTWRYLRSFRRAGDAAAAMLESTRSHLAYNIVILVIVAVALIFLS